MTNVGPQRSGGGMPKWLIALAVVFLLILLVCCGGLTTCYFVAQHTAARVREEGLGGLTLNKDGTGFTMKTDTGELNLGGGSLPTSFPKDLPVYAGMRSQTSAVNSKDESGTVVLSGKAAASDVVDWYEKEMKSNGWTETANQTVGEGSAMSFTKEDRQASVLVVPSGTGESAVTLTYGKATGSTGGTPGVEGNTGGQEKISPAGGGAGNAGASGGGTGVTPDRAAELKAMKLPTNFPADVPVYKGMTSTFSASDNMKGSGWVVLEGKVPAQTVADYYAKQLKDSGWTETMNKQVAEATILKYTKDTREVTVQVGPGDKGMTLLQLAYEKKSE